MFLVFKAARVRCFSCGEAGFSRPRRGYQLLFVGLLALGALGLGQRGHSWRHGRGSWGSTGFLVAAAWVAFTREAHACRACGKHFVRPL